MLYALWVTVFGLLFYSIFVVLDFLMGITPAYQFILVMAAIVTACLLIAEEINAREEDRC